ncbi:MAG: hypothetical protein J0H31_03775 [Alphaproteobacteria bacterium]|nr:hypothetical protein [Alphaproteobacteria bacterium]
MAYRSGEARKLAVPWDRILRFIGKPRRAERAAYLGDCRLFFARLIDPIKAMA